MDEVSSNLLAELASVAGTIGPALSPVGHLQQLQELVDAARETFAAKACSIATLDDDEANLVFTVASGAGAAELTGLTVPFGVGIGGWVVSSGQALEVSEVTRDPRFARDVAERTGYIPSAILAAPLETEHHVVGVVEVLDRDADRPGADRDLVTLGLFARHAALAIYSSRAFRDLGRLLLEALTAEASGDLLEALHAVGRKKVHDKELVALATTFVRVGRVGPVEQRLAVTLLDDVLSYLEQKGHR